MKLHNIVNTGNGYCGPAAISAITGLTTAESAAAIRIYGGARRRAIKSAYLYELKYTLQKLGYEVEEAGVQGGGDRKKMPTLARWLREREDPSAMTLVFVTSHFAVVKGRKYIDNHTGKPVWISKAPGRRRRVRNWLTIRKA